MALPVANKVNTPNISCMLKTNNKKTNNNNNKNMLFKARLIFMLWIHNNSSSFPWVGVFLRLITFWMLMLLLLLPACRLFCYDRRKRNYWNLHIHWRFQLKSLPLPACMTILLLHGFG